MSGLVVDFVAYGSGALVQRGEGLDFFQGDISIEGPNPVSPSGGNTGSGRTRFWMHTDSIQQLQGRAGARAVTGVRPEIAISGGYNASECRSNGMECNTRLVVVLIIWYIRGTLDWYYDSNRSRVPYCK